MASRSLFVKFTRPGKPPFSYGFPMGFQLKPPFSIAQSLEGQAQQVPGAHVTCDDSACSAPHATWVTGIRVEAVDCCDLFRRGHNCGVIFSYGIYTHRIQVSS